MTPISILQKVRQAHDDVSVQVDALERRLARLAATADAAARTDTLMAVRQALTAIEVGFAHSVALEHSTVFPLVRETLPEASPLLLAQRGEHGDLAAMIHTLAALVTERSSDWRDEQLRVVGRDLIDLLRIHMRKEEAALYRVLERVLTAEELALASRPPHRPSRGAGSRAGGVHTSAPHTPRRSPNSHCQ